MSTSITPVIKEVRELLHTTFANIDTWFDRPPDLRQYQPAEGNWTIELILEHISLTNHYLLILIEKGARKALQLAERQDLNAALAQYQFRREQLDAIGQHGAFRWIRPEHMEPTGAKPLDEVRQLLHQQVNQCNEVLNQLSNGAGILYATTMSVNNLGKIDVYEYICFLAMHGQRHITQMQHIEAEFYSAER